MNPFQDAVVYEFQNNSNMPALDLHLYNTTANSHTGVHYDPVAVPEVKPKKNETKTLEGETVRPVLKRDRGKRLRKSTAFNPHDESPSFLQIKSRCDGNCADGAVCSEKPTQ